jgi:hypothetical protein
VRTTDHEKELLTSDPIKFVDLALDACDKQKMDSIKTKGARMLEYLYDIDDSKER